LLADAMDDGAIVLSSTEVQHIDTKGSRAVAVRARTERGAAVRVRADRAVIVGASAVQTPALLLRSGLTQGPVGHGFSCHPGVSLAGRFREPVRMWEGATQGHEVTGLRHEGLKFEVLGFGLAILATRLDGVGRELAREIADLAHWLDWGAAVRAEARGRVRVVAGRPVVTFTPTNEDVRRFRRGLRVLGDLMLAAGAEELSLGVKGWPQRIREPRELERFEREGPTGAGAFKAAITHMFGTARMGADARTSVVRPDFRHHHVDRLYVADSSVFPSNIGVNPQIPIMVLGELCGASAVSTPAQFSRSQM
jgi:choline dehydrogenase-like flavoprotein